MHALKAGRPQRDLASRADVAVLLQRFYGQVLDDDLLAQPFTEIRLDGLDSHLPVMCHFWETVLFRAGLYQGSAVRAHQPVHDRHVLAARHFLRWLALWNTTIDQMYRGPIAERAKIQAVRIARAMHRRLTGNDSAELDHLVSQTIPPHPQCQPPSSHRIAQHLATARRPAVVPIPPIENANQ
jgi:hemoglobin